MEDINIFEDISSRTGGKLFFVGALRKIICQIQKKPTEYLN